LVAGKWGSFTAVSAFYDCPLWQTDLVRVPCFRAFFILDPEQQNLPAVIFITYYLEEADLHGVVMFIWKFSQPALHAVVFVSCNS
jgi:hypothetical protein